MSVAALIRAMAAAGAPPEAIALAVEAIEAAGAKADAMRAATRERVARHREAKRYGNADVTVCNATVTLQSVTPLPPLPPLAPPPTPPTLNPPLNPPTDQKKGGVRKGARIPADFEPSRQDALSAGLPESRVQAEIDKFRDYWQAKAGADACKLDWPATWRNWCRNAMERGPRAPPAPEQPSLISVVSRKLQESIHADQNRSHAGAGLGEAPAWLLPGR